MSVSICCCCFLDGLRWCSLINGSRSLPVLLHACLSGINDCAQGSLVIYLNLGDARAPFPPQSGVDASPDQPSLFDAMLRDQSSIFPAAYPSLITLLISHFSVSTRGSLRNRHSERSADEHPQHNQQSKAITQAPWVADPHFQKPSHRRDTSSSGWK